MDLSTILPVAVCGAVMLGVWAMLALFSGKDSRAAARLDELKNPLSRDRARKKEGMSSLIERAAPALSKALEPKSELEQNALKIRLANAGFHSPLAPQLFLAIKFSCLLLGGLLGGGIGMLTYGMTQNCYVTMGLSAGAGFYLPELILRYLKSCRQEKIFLSLPDALDLLVVCVEAGLGL